MRKILALVLAIATLAVLAVLPVSAAIDTGVYTEGINAGKAKFDGTSTAMSLGTQLNNPNGDLIVTELLIDSSISGAQATDPTTNCYNYIEIYNRGTTSVNLSSVAIVGISDRGSNSWWDNHGNFQGDIKTDGAGKAYIDAGSNIYDGNGQMSDGKYSHTGLTSAQANTNRYDKAPIDNPAYADMWLEPGEFAIVWLWSDNCVNASKNEGTSLAEPMNGRSNFPKFRDHYAELMGIQKYQTNPDGSFVVEGGEYVFTEEFQQLESTLIVATHLDGSLNLSFTTTSKMYALVDNTFDPSAEEFVIQGNASNPYQHNNKVYSFFGWGTGGNREIIGSVEDSVTIYVPSASKAELYHAYKLQENAEYNVDENYDYVKIGIATSYLEMAVMSTVEAPSIGSMPSYQWKYVDPARMQTYAEGGDTTYITDWEKSWDATTRNLAIQDATTGELLTEIAAGATEAAWMSGTFAALKAERVTVLTDDDLDAPEDERPGTIVDQYWWETMLGSNRKKDNGDEGLPIWAIILIIVGAVVVAGGVAVLVIILVKKKKAAATAAWYAEHANEIPADENSAGAAAEDTPAEENKE